MQLFYFVKVERRKLRLYLYLYLYSHWRPIFHFFCFLRHSLTLSVRWFSGSLEDFCLGETIMRGYLKKKEVIIDMFESGTCRLLPQKKQARLTDLPSVTGLDLSASNHVPDAGHPVRHEGEHGHQQGQHHGAVLRVAVQLLQQAEEAQQPHSLEEVNQRCLGRRGGVWSLALNTAATKKRSLKFFL